jgi:hypothetical protein
MTLCYATLTFASSSFFTLPPKPPPPTTSQQHYQKLLPHPITIIYLYLKSFHAMNGLKPRTQITSCTFFATNSLSYNAALTLSLFHLTIHPSIHLIHSEGKGKSFLSVSATHILKQQRIEKYLELISKHVAVSLTRVKQKSDPITAYPKCQATAKATHRLHLKSYLYNLGDYFKKSIHVFVLLAKRLDSYIVLLYNFLG